MAHHDGLDQSQAQPGSAVALARAGKAVKRFEDALAQVDGNAWPVVSNRQHNAPAITPGAGVDNTGTMTQGVFQQIAYGPAQQPGDAVHHQSGAVCRRIQCDPDGVALLRHQSKHVDWLHRAEIGFTRVQPTGQQNFINELVQFLDIACNFFLDAACGLWAHQFKPHANPCQR